MGGTPSWSKNAPFRKMFGEYSDSMVYLTFTLTKIQTTICKCKPEV
jgi:hypothetical protein